MPESAAAGEPHGPRTDGPSDMAHTLRLMLVVLALTAGFALIPRALRSLGGSGGGAGEDAPDFTASLVANASNLPSAPGADQTVTLSALRGKPIILDFWATWCGPCQAEAPIVNAIAQRFKDKGLVVIGVNTSDGEGLAAAWVRKKGISMPIAYDEGNAIAARYRVDSLPSLVFISKTGKIFAVRHGITSDADLERLVREML